MPSDDMKRSVVRIIVLAMLLWPLTTIAQPRSAQPKASKPMPYKGYTGTVHQFGFIGGWYATSNPNYSETSQKETYHDFGIGVVYTLHDYLTRQVAVDVLSSFNVLTAKALEHPEYSDNKKKIIWPVDVRLNVGPSEDLQAYIGAGLQWNMLQKNTGDYLLTTGAIPTKTIHQLCGNAAAGFNVFGPQNYMFHLSLGAKFHFPITDNDNTETEAGVVDMSKDRGCMVLTGGITLDIDRRKNACVMLNYEYPLGTPKATRADGTTGGFFDNTQTFSIGLIFHIGGTR